MKYSPTGVNNKQKEEAHCPPSCIHLKTKSTLLLPFLLCQLCQFLTKLGKREITGNNAILGVKKEIRRKVVDHVKTGYLGIHALEIGTVRPDHTIKPDGLFPHGVVVVKSHTDNLKSTRTVLQVKFHKLSIIPAGVFDMCRPKMHQFPFRGNVVQAKSVAIRLRKGEVRDNLAHGKFLVPF